LRERGTGGEGPGRAHRRLFLALTLGLLLPNLSCHRETPPAVPVPFCEGRSVLQITVPPGEYVHVIADQQERDAVLTLADAAGRRLLRVDSLVAAPAPPWPAEEVHWVAPAGGPVRIELTVTLGARGACAPRLAARRPATAADRRRARAETALAWGHALRRTDSPERCRAAIEPYGRAARRFAGLGLAGRRAEALFGLGLLQRLCLRDDPAALRAFTRALAPAVGEVAFEAKVRQHLGDLRYRLGDLPGAAAEYRQSLGLRRSAGDRAAEAVTSDSLGLALHLQGRYDEAAGLFDRALALWRREDGLRVRAGFLLNRGHLHFDLGETERARERFGEALALYRQAGDRGGQGTALNGLGLVELAAGRAQAALVRLREARTLRQPGSRGLAVTLTTLGVAYRQLGRWEDARRAYAQALPIFVALGDVREQGRSLGNLGWLEAATGRPAAALARFEQALGRFQVPADAPNGPDRAWILGGEALVLRRRGDLPAARAAMEESLAEIERHRIRQVTSTTRAAFFATRQDSYDFLIDLLLEMDRREPTAGFAAEALEVNERSLARSLLDVLAARGTDLRGLHPAGGSATAPELHAREREVERAIEVLVSRQTRLAEEADAAALVRQVEEELGRRWQELERVRTALRAGDPRYAALTEPRPWTAEEIRRDLLDRDTLLLEYRLGAERSTLWAATPEALATFELPGRAVIEKEARRAVELLARGTPKAEGSVRHPLAALSRLLLAPAAHLLPGKRLLVVGDGILQSLPFAALPKPGPGPRAELGEPLVAGHEIVLLPSVSVLGVLRREVAGRARAPHALWVLASPDFGGRDDLALLPSAEQEAEAILRLVPAAERRALFGREARRAAVLDGTLGDYRILHFATHGAFGAGEPGGGRLVLAQVGPHGLEANGFLHLGDIYDLDLRADLVVLSACRSALGNELRGEGVMGMTRGFFYAGAERVVVSLWNVNDRAGAELMERFYRGLLVEELAPPAALRAAQDAIRRQRRWRSPYYWAGFVLQGEWRGSVSGGGRGPSPRVEGRGSEQVPEPQARTSPAMIGGRVSVPDGSLTAPPPFDATSMGMRGSRGDASPEKSSLSRGESSSS
jgi:CHAT domain-containing protein